MAVPTPDPDEVKLATQAYIYGYPLVYNMNEIGGFVSGQGRTGMQADLNTFAHARALAGPEVKFVSPNNDTLYTTAAVDVRSGPVALHVPDTHDRYCVLQFVDAWTNNFAYIGRRATGTAAADFLLVAPDHDEPAPDGMRTVRAASGVFVIVGRVQVDGDADLPAVHALQDEFTLRPLDPDAAPSGVPSAVAGVPAALEWWERFRVALAAFPPSPQDAPALDVCAAPRVHRR